jgi:hypothetical protein
MKTEIEVKDIRGKNLTYGDLEVGDIFSFHSTGSRYQIWQKSDQENCCWSLTGAYFAKTIRPDSLVTRFSKVVLFR